MIAGARISHTWFDFNTFTEEAFLPATFGHGGSEKSNPFTPRLGVQYHIDHNNQLYATYSEGFRVGGANAPIPPGPACVPSEKLVGKVPPLSYGPDKVQSYEIGAKNSLFDNRVQLANSVYYIKWNSIQQSIYLVSCGLQYTDNVGYAVSKGAEIQADFLITKQLTLNTTAGYNSAYFTQNAPGETPVVAKGDAVAGFANPLPRWSTTLGLSYAMHLFDHASFVRFDYEFQGVNDRLPPGTDPRTSQYSPFAFQLPATHFASLRGGMHFGAWEVDLFCDNLFNNNAIINYVQEGIDFNNFNPYNPADLPPAPLTYWYSFQPRTVGVTAILAR
jgi:outer membrane receptor protein involved in Fe transport